MGPLEYYLHQPKRTTTAVVFSSPHSGRDYPKDFLAESLLDKHRIRSSEDAFVDDLFDCAPDFGAPLLAASAPRAFVDLNRSDRDLDPAIVTGAPPNRTNARVASGLGVIPRVVAEGRAIRSGKISLAEAVGRLDRYYHPYHDRLQRLLDTAKAGFGQVLLVDCHSMPSEALGSGKRTEAPRPQIVLGDRFGGACGSEFVSHIENLFRREGFKVARNSPFAGAYITQNYGDPDAGQHALQIEIDRSLYMNETTIARSSDFVKTKRRLARVIEGICEMARPRQARLAAE